MTDGLPQDVQVEDARIEAEGLGFPEGPVVLPDGAVAFVDLADHCIRIWDKGAVRVLCEVPGSPNGMRLGPDGALYVANNGGLWPGKGKMDFADPQYPGCIQRVLLDGRWEVFADGYGTASPAPNRPNDLVFTPEGDVVFTNPQNWEMIVENPDTPYRGGQLCLARRDGTIEVLAQCTGLPNGLGFHPDGSLVAGMTIAHHYLKFAWAGGAALGEPELFVQMDARFHPDGMVFHEGRLYGAGSAGNRLVVAEADGTVATVLNFGRSTQPTNCCVREDRLWVTLGKAGTLVSIPLP